MNVTFLTWGHYQLRQCEFSTPAKPLPFQQHPTSKRPLHAIPARLKRRFCPTCRLPKLIRRHRMFYRLRKHFQHTPYPLLDATLAALVVITGVEMLVTLARLLD